MIRWQNGWRELFDHFASHHVANRFLLCFAVINGFAGGRCARYDWITVNRRG
ncbi:hypothetical protein [Novipirellula caenicola]|uniref:hypothetical protein n=1 Tax=Novipirellula caenicola TaxID=1536901 RepID=UPI0031ECB47D